MVARLDWPRWGWALGLAGTAAPLGLLVGFDPALAILVALSAAFALIAFTNLAHGLALYMFVSFIALPPFGLYDAMARLLLALTWFAVVATKRERELEFPAVHPLMAVAMLLFVGWAAISVVWAEDAAKALESATYYALSVILLLIVFTAVRTVEDLRPVLLAFVAGCVVATLYGVSGSTEEGERLATAVLDPNLLAAALVAGVALSIGLLALYRSPPIRLALLPSGVLLAVAIWLTTSRSALVAVAVCLVAAIVLAGRWRPQMLVASLAAVTLTYFYFAGVASDQARERISEPFSGQERTTDGRSTIWQLALRAFDDRPVTGVGAGNFPVVSVHYLLEPGVERGLEQIIDDPKRKVAHSTYLSVLSELGIVGIVLFSFVVVSSLGAAIGAARRFGAGGEWRLQIASVSIVVALIGVLTVSVFQSDPYGKQLWLLLALGPAMLAIAKRDRAGRLGPPPGR